MSERMDQQGDVMAAIKATIEQGDTLFFRQRDRNAKLIESPESSVYRKRARVIARRIERPFAVETAHGILHAESGDWLATNHDDDDPSSDIWPISDERMRATYEEAE